MRKLKKLLAILLLFVFLFNMGFYRLLFCYLEYTAGLRLEKQIEASAFHEKELITIKIPLRLHYLTDWKDFAPAKGEITVNGSTYKYVRQKVHRDTLILACINFKEKALIKKNNSEYFKKVNDLAGHESKKGPPKPIKDIFFEESLRRTFSLYGLDRSQSNLFVTSSCIAGFSSTIETPPEATRLT